MATKQVIVTTKELELDYDNLVTLFQDNGLNPPDGQKFSLHVRKEIGTSSLVGFLDEEHKLVIQYVTYE